MYWQLADSEEGAVFWIRILVMGSSMIPYTYLHFVSHFVGRSLPKLVGLGYAIAITLNVLAWTPYIFTGVEPRMGFEFWPVAGPVFPVYFGGFAIVVGYCFVLLVKQYRKSTVKVQNQNKYLIIGTAIGFVGGGTNFPLWLNIPVPPILHGLSILYILGIGYSVLKYRLLDFNEMVIRALSLMTLATFIGAAFAAMFSLLMGYAYPGFYPHGYIFWWVVFSGMSFVCFIISPTVSNFFDELVEAKLASARFAYRNQLRQLSDDWIFNIQHEETVRAIVEGIYETMLLDYAALYIRKGMETTYSCEAAIGSRPRIQELNAGRLDPVVRLIHARRHALLLEEEADRSPAFRKSMRYLCRENPNLHMSDVVVPVAVQGSFYGFLILGSSSVSGAFADVDLIILENLCSQYALALKSREVERMANQVEKLVSLGTMAAGLSHELRNPLVSVKTLGSLLKKESSGSLRLNPLFSQTVQRDIKRISGIVGGVSAFAQNSNLPLAHVDVVDVINETRAALEEKMNQEQIEFSLNVEEGTPCALGDFDQLAQIFFNIIENAVYAISEWKDRPKVGRISALISSKGNDRFNLNKWIEIRIEDNGPGMSAEFQSRIFDPFVTSRDTGLRYGASGTGLGLAIVKKIIDQHKGRITVDSALGKGAVFRVVIPCV
jgi:two-component system nitrogen regulation sensor histidine kinase GlnL